MDESRRSELLAESKRLLGELHTLKGKLRSTVGQPAAEMESDRIRNQLRDLSDRLMALGKQYCEGFDTPEWFIEDAIFYHDPEAVFIREMSDKDLQRAIFEAKEPRQQQLLQGESARRLRCAGQRQEDPNAFSAEVSEEDTATQGKKRGDKVKALTDILTRLGVKTPHDAETKRGLISTAMERAGCPVPPRELSSMLGRKGLTKERPG